VKDLDPIKHIPVFGSLQPFILSVLDEDKDKVTSKDDKLGNVEISVEKLFPDLDKSGAEIEFVLKGQGHGLDSTVTVQVLAV
jgi:hypothetical protein